MFKIRPGPDGILKLIGRLDASEAAGAMGVLIKVDHSLTADCSELDYISSAGLGVIMETYKRLRAQGLGLRLVNVSPHVWNVFRYVGLDRVIEIEQTGPSRPSS
jgi:anti-sigma B factor antagonist